MIDFRCFDDTIFLKAVHAEWIRSKERFAGRSPYWRPVERSLPSSTVVLLTLMVPAMFRTSTTGYEFGAWVLRAWTLQRFFLSGACVRQDAAKDLSSAREHRMSPLRSKTWPVALPGAALMIFAAIEAMRLDVRSFLVMMGIVKFKMGIGRDLKMQLRKLEIRFNRGLHGYFDLDPFRINQFLSRAI